MQDSLVPGQFEIFYTDLFTYLLSTYQVLGSIRPRKQHWIKQMIPPVHGVRLYWEEENTMNIYLVMSTMKKGNVKVWCAQYWKCGCQGPNGDGPWRALRALLLDPLTTERAFSTRNIPCPGQHLRAQPSVERANFSFTQSTVFHFTHLQNHSQHSGLS